MKESIRNTKSRDELSAEILEILEKIMEMHRLKKNFFLFCFACIKWFYYCSKLHKCKSSHNNSRK